MRIVAACVAVLTLAGASTPTHSPEAQAKLDNYLAGRVAGHEAHCLNIEKTNHPVGIDDSTMLFIDGPRIWRTELRGSFNCGATDPQSVLVSQSGWRICAGQKLVLTQNGEAVGACYVGTFVPYTKP